MRVSIHQPYFIPYAGYFRLMAAADIFVVYDNAQYPKGGYVNRNRLTKNNGDIEWLTLPIKKAPLETEIKDIQFSSNGSDDWLSRTKRFQVFSKKPMSRLLLTAATATGFSSPLTAIMTAMSVVRSDLGYPNCPFVHASTMNLTPGLKGKDVVFEICERFKAREYINASGGATLYDKEEFEKRGIKLKIFEPYKGSGLSILERIEVEGPAQVKKEIEKNVDFIS